MIKEKIKLSKISYDEMDKIQEMMREFTKTNEGLYVYIEFDNKKVIFHSNLPGSIIGKGGKTYDEFLNKIKEITNNKVKKLVIKEIAHAVCNGKNLRYSGPYKNIS